MGKQGLKLTVHDTPVTGVNIKPPKVKNLNQSKPITCKVKESQSGTKLKS